MLGSDKTAVFIGSTLALSPGGSVQRAIISNDRIMRARLPVRKEASGGEVGGGDCAYILYRPVPKTFGKTVVLNLR